MSHTDVNSAPIHPVTGLPMYGMDLDLFNKQQAKWTEGGGDALQLEAKEWIEAVLGIQFATDNMHEELKSGVVLCNLANAIQPGSAPRPSGMSAPFKQMENIGSYLAACEKIGTRKDDTFQTVSLYENQDMLAVIRQIHSLGSVAQKNGFDGPPLGSKIADQNARTFTDAQRAEAAAAPTLLGKGSHGHASQAGNKDGQKNIVKTNDTIAPSAELGQMSMGSTGLASQAGTKVGKEIVVNQGQ